MDQTVPEYRSSESLFRREMAVIGVGVTLLLGAAYVAWLLIFRINEPDAVVKKFIEADRAGRFTEQKALVADTWDAALILNLVQGFRQQTGVSPFERYRIVSSSVDGTTAYVNVEVTINPPNVPGIGVSPNTQSQPLMVPFQLIRRGDRWKIDPSRTMVGLTGALMSAGFQQLMPRIQSLFPPLPGSASPSTPPPSTSAPARP